MISALVGKSSWSSPLESFNNLVGAAGIGGKKLLEFLHIADTDDFTTYGGHESLS